MAPRVHPAAEAPARAVRRPGARGLAAIAGSGRVWFPGSMVPFSLENRVDGLIEARVFTLPDLAAADSYAQTLADVVAKVVRHGPVLCADHRPVVIYRQEVADRLAKLFSLMNSKLTRVAVVVSRSNATLAM